MGAARRYLPSDPGDLARSAVPLGLLVLAAAVPTVRLAILVGLAAGAAIAIVRGAPVRWAWAAAVPVALSLFWGGLPAPAPAVDGSDCANPASPVATWRALEALVVLASLAGLAVVLNPGLSRSDWLVRGGQRRVCHTLELDTPGGRLVVANLHASNSPDRRLVGAEIRRAAAFLAGAERCVLCGDFNVRRHTVPGFTEPIGGIDQILVRGLDLERGPDAWAEERRTVDGIVLSDHAPVEAVVQRTS